MNIPPTEADHMSLYRYESLVWNWNDAHEVDDLGAPDPELTQKLIDRINANPQMTGAALQTT
jgi:hypothetical protein